VSYLIRLEGTNLRFSAAHFATFRGECEPLHGHNYAVTVEIAGELSDDSWVVDFSDVKEVVAGLCHELDHKFILQQQSRHLLISEEDGLFDIRFGDQRYVIPSSDVIPLPIDNSTVERLAEWLAGRLRTVLQGIDARNVRSIGVGVEEAPGQAAVFRLTL
jgi:6-pyruvoyltetrahydropterin/6-carboxytetrahydropterin synthase